MANDQSRRRLPPYVSYRTFHSFIEGLQQQGIPARIDRSYWGDRLSGSNGTQLMTALRFLGLVNNAGIPTPKLKQLVSSRTEQRAGVLKDVTVESFDFLFRGSLDPQTATYLQLQEALNSTFQLSSDVSRKCIKFFIALAGDANIPLSSFITKKIRASHPGISTKSSAKKISARANQTPVVPQQAEDFPGRMSWDKMLLAKFPTFDPSWSDEIKLKWFDAFDELLKRSMGNGTK